MSPTELGERIVALEQQVLALRDTVRAEAASIREDLLALHEQIHGPPWERSIRGRLHTLETTEAAARAAEVALETARELQAQAGERRFSRRERAAIVATAVLGAGCAIGTLALGIVALVT